MADEATLEVIIKMREEGEAAMRQVRDQIKDIKEALKDLQEQARDTNTSLNMMSATGIDRTTDSGERNRITIRDMLKAYREAQDISAALGTTMGITGAEFEHAAKAFINTDNSVRSMTQDFRDVQAVSTVLGSTIGVGASEFERLAAETMRTTEAADKDRSAIQSLTSAHRDAQAVSAALGATIGVGAHEFERLAAEAINASDGTNTVNAASKNWFQSLVGGIPAIGNFLVTMAGIPIVGPPIVIALLAVIVAVVSLALTFIGAAVMITAAVVTILTVTVAGFAAIGLAMALTLGPLGLLVAGVILLGDRMFTTGRTTLDPLLKIEEALGKMADTWGAKALPMTVQMTNWALTMVPHVTALGLSLLEWFGPRLPAILGLATQATDFLFLSLRQIGDVLGPFIDQMMQRVPAIGPLAQQAFGAFLGALKGLLDNLVKFVDWFIKEWPKLEPLAKQIMDQVGKAIQQLGKTAKEMVDWFVTHWPEIQKTASNMVGPMHAAGDSIKFVADMMVGLMRGYNEFVAAMDGIGRGFSIMGQHADDASRAIGRVLLLLSNLPMGGDKFKSLAEAALSAGSPGGSSVSGGSGAGGATGFTAFAEGGTVPGPRGAPMVAMVHGGEVVLSNDRQDDIVRLLASINGKLDGPWFSNAAYGRA